jgi:hypothetical protein
MAENDSSNAISINPYILVLALGGATTGSAGLSWLVQPGLQQDAVKACYDNSRIAINQADSHGDEIQDVRTHIAALRAELFERTQDRYTNEDARKRWAAHERIELDRDRANATQNQRLSLIESQLYNHDHQ